MTQIASVKAVLFLTYLFCFVYVICFVLVSFILFCATLLPKEQQALEKPVPQASACTSTSKSNVHSVRARQLFQDTGDVPQEDHHLAPGYLAVPLAEGVPD